MHLHVVNPNSSEAMTRGIEAAANAAAPPGVTVETTRSEGAPQSIEGPVDEARAVPSMLDRIIAADGANAHLIACFDDTGLDAARALAAVPVVGIGEAAYHMATLLADRFAVVTSVPEALPVLRANIARTGFSSRCAGLRAAGVPVLEIDAGTVSAVDAIRRETERAVTADGADVVVLGCAGMADLAEQLSAEFAVPVVEGISAGVGLAVAAGRLFPHKRRAP